MLLIVGLLVSLAGIFVQPASGQYQPPTSTQPTRPPPPPPPPPRTDPPPPPPPRSDPPPPTRRTPPQPTRPTPAPPSTRYPPTETTPEGPPSYDYSDGTTPPQCDPDPTPCVCPSPSPPAPQSTPPYLPPGTPATAPPTRYTPPGTPATPPTRYTPSPPTNPPPTTTRYVPPTNPPTPTPTRYSPPGTVPPTGYFSSPPTPPSTQPTRSVPVTTRPGQYTSSAPGDYVATNAEMQAAITSCSSTCSSLASSGEDPVSTDTLRKMSTALDSCRSLSYDQPTLTTLSPAISKMQRTTTSARSNCKQQPLSAAAQTNLSRNLVWWTNNGYNPTVQQVQNLFNTASQYLEQYC